MTISKDLKNAKCKPCEGGILPMNFETVKNYLEKVAGWTLKDDKTPEIEKLFVFNSFDEANHFVNTVAEISEEENHHPVLLIQFNKVTITLFTHAARGLTENDFILAAKIDEAYLDKKDSKKRD